jgi:amino acid transporter
VSPDVVWSTGGGARVDALRHRGKEITMEVTEKPTTAAARANVIFGGTGGGKFIAIVAMVSIAGVLNGWVLLQGRVPYAAAEDGLFPKQFAQVDEKRQTPVFGIVVSSLLITALLALNFQQKAASSSSSGTSSSWPR